MSVHIYTHTPTHSHQMILPSLSSPPNTITNLCLCLNLNICRYHSHTTDVNSAFKSTGCAPSNGINHGDPTPPSMTHTSGLCVCVGVCVCVCLFVHCMCCVCVCVVVCRQAQKHERTHTHTHKHTPDKVSEIVADVINHLLIKNRK